MTPLTLTRLAKYTEQCRQLKRDIEHALEDMEFLASGGSIYYAVDFAEIYAYILPSPPNDDYLLFLARTAEDALAIQLLVSKCLFEHAETRPLLLPPYAVEFEDFFCRFRERAFDDLLYDSLMVFQDARATLEEPEFERFAEIALGYEQSDRQPSDREMREFIKFLESNCPSLLALLQPDFARPLERMKRLLREGVFADLKAVLGRRVDVREEDEVVRACDKRLEEARGEDAHAANLVDSIAISMMDKANEQGEPQQKRILLVTRSKHMVNVVDQELSTGTLQRHGTSFIRHPRSFYILDVLDSMEEAKVRDKLKEECKVLELFLEAVKEVRIPGDEATGDVETAITDIVSNWRSSEALEASLAAARDAAAVNVPQSMRQILQLIEKSSDLRRLVFARLDEIGSRLESRHQYLGLFLGSMLPESREQLRAKLETQVYEAKCVLRTNLGSFPYTLELYSEEAADLIRDIVRLEEFGWEEVMTFFRSVYTEDVGYERALIMACMFGALNKWKAAELYCERALESASLETSQSPHEGLYFLAICQRKVQPSVARHKRALELLSRALEEQRAWKACAADDDPRYLLEMGTQIFMLSHKLGDQIDESVPGPERGLQLLAKALGLCGDDAMLRLQIINNRLYYRISAGHAHELEEVERDYQSLLAIQQERGASESDWPPFLLDTVAWSQFILYGAESEADRELILGRLRMAEASIETMNEESKIVRYHLRTFQDWIKSGCPDADCFGWARSP